MEEESSQVFFFQDSHSANYTYHRYTWTVENNDDTVRAYSTSIYQQDNTSTSDKLKSYQYPWLSVDALRPGTVTVTVTHYCYNGDSWWRPTGTVESGTVTFTLHVMAKESGLAIENHIPEDGTLKPVWREPGAGTNAVRYEWSKEYFHTFNNGNDSPEGHRKTTPISEDAILDDGSINVAIDARRHCHGKGFQRKRHSVRQVLHLHGLRPGGKRSRYGDPPGGIRRVCAERQL